MSSYKLAQAYFLSVAMVLVHAHCVYIHALSIAITQGLHYNA